uniref:LLGL domain-containing protein n=1 Tax=Rhabditophanes sp. KR3021 TaxID=114890 RepID=A0AC35UCB7_9BILA
MSLSLNRSDLIQVGATNNNCLTLIKEAAFHLEKGEQNDDEDIVIDNKSKEEKRKKDEKKKDEKNKRNKLLVTDKVVIGSQDGTLTVIEKKKNSIAILSKSLPGPPITSVKLGGTTATHDRIFFSADNFIRGFFKKGKQFFGFETNFTDAIQCMFIYGLELLVSSNNVLTHYHDTQEVNSYICGEPITDIICLPKKEGSWVGGRQLTPVIACEDKKIKVLCAGQLIYLIKINDVPTILRLYMNDGGYNKEKVLYGTRNGTIGLLWLPENDYTLLWEINTTSTSQITSFCFYNLFGGSYPDLILGKDDGMIEMYTLDADTINLRQLYATNETITGIVCGRVNNQNYDEIIVSTYTGWIFSLSTEPVAGETGGNLPHVPQMDIRIEELEKEVKILEESVVEHRQKFEFANPADDESDIYAYELEVNDKLILNNELASYTFTIELIIPIEFYVIQTTLDLMLIDVDKNQSILSITEPERFPEEGNKLVAFYRCQPNTKKIQFCVNTFEGCHGDIKVYIAPSRIPRTIQVSDFI